MAGEPATRTTTHGEIVNNSSETGTSSFTVQTGVLQVIGAGVFFQQFRVRPPGEPAQPTGLRGRVVRGRAAHERELVQTLVLAIRPVGRYHLLVLARRQLELLPGVSLENVMSVGALSFDSAGCKRHARHVNNIVMIAIISPSLGINELRVEMKFKKCCYLN